MSKKVWRALLELDFLAMGDIWMTPAMHLADIILPCATPWESEFVNYCTPYLIHRHPLIDPLWETWPDLKIIFEIAARLGYNDKFWDGDVKNAFNYMIEPLGKTIGDLEPRGLYYPPPKLLKCDIV